MIDSPDALARRRAGRPASRRQGLLAFLVAVLGLVASAGDSRAQLVTMQFTNGDPIVFDDVVGGPGSLYPSIINVSGLTAQVFKVTVTLRGVTHTFPDDLDILLVGPGGQNVMLMSDCGLDNGLNDVSITLDDDAATSLPDSDPSITTGAYKPSNYGSLDVMDAPAPPRPYGSQLVTFRGTNPNGDWLLFTRDDLPENGGLINEGWSLTIVTSEPIADLAIGQSANVATLPVGSNIVYTISVTNFGPADARATVIDTLPASVNILSATPSSGGCTIGSGIVTCDLGVLLSGATRQIVLVAAPTLGGSLSNRVSVSGNQVDIVPTNNTAPPLVTTVLPVADVAVGLTAAPTNALLAQPIVYTVQVTNRGPNAASSVVVTNTLPASMTVLSATPSQGSCTNAAGLVTCVLGALPSGGVVSISITGRTGMLGLNSNRVHAASSELDFSPSNNDAGLDVQVLPNADFQLSAVPIATSVLFGQPWTLTLVASNRGPNTTTASLSAVLPASLQFVSATPSQGSCSNGPGGLSCQLDPIAPGQQATVTLTTVPLVLGVVTNAFAVTGGLPDPDNANNAVVATATLTTNVDLDLTMSDAPDPVWLGEDVVYFLTLTNRGLNTANGVAVTNSLPAGLNFVSVSASRGAASHAGNTVFCTIGTMLPGAGATISVTGRSLTAGFVTNSARASAFEADIEPRNNVTSQVTRVIMPSGQFSNTAPILIPSFGTASPYASTIFVSGLTASVFRARVTLTNLAHTYPDDLDIVLVGPQGQSVLLMSDAGGELAMTNVTLTFDADTVVPLPDAGPLGSALYAPSDYEPGTDVFPAPAPSGPYSSSLAVFQDTNPNGLWSLYVVDDATKDSGVIAGGWGLTFSTLDPIADLTVSQQLSANPVAVSNHLFFTCFVTNRGPAIATGLQFTDVIDPSLGVVFATSPGGSCTNSAGTVLCNLAPLPSGASVMVTIDVIPRVSRSFTNRVSVAAATRDLRPDNNTNDVVFEVQDPPVITLQPVGLTVTNGASVTFQSDAAGTAPIALQWQRNGLNIPGATNGLFPIASASSLDAGSYRLRATNRVGTAFSDPAVLRVLGPPAVSEIPDQVIDEDTSAGPIPFTVEDVESPADLITLTGQSSNTNLVPVANIGFGGTGSNRTVIVTPLPNANGQATITVLAQDPDTGITARSFLLTVLPVNDPPTISHTPDQATPEDTLLVIPFLAADIDTPSDSLAYRITSSNPTLIPTNAVVFAGTNSTRTAAVLPATNQFGSATITLIVSDTNGGTASDSFVITVSPVNDPPSFDPAADVTFGEDGGLGIVLLSGISAGPANEPQNLQITVHSDNPVLVPAPEVAYASPAATATLTFAPLPNATGSALITVTVSDGGTTNRSFSRSFTVTILPTNDPPTILVPANVSTPEDVPLLLPVTLFDPDDAAETLTLSALSLNTNLVRNSAILPGGTGANRTLLITPEADTYGVIPIQLLLIAADPHGASTTNVLNLLITPVNDAPTLNPPSNLTVAEDAGNQTVPLTGITVGYPNESQSVLLSAVSSNPALIPDPAITYTSPNPTGTLTFRPNTNASGTATLTITADDGVGGVTKRSFVVTVTPANDGPAILPIASQSTPEDTPIVIAFTLLDLDTPLGLVTVTGASSNATLVAATNIVFDGGGSNRTATITPRKDQSGLTAITLFVSDGFATNSTTFQLTVSATNDPPTLNPIPNFVTNSLSGNPTYVIPINGITSGATNENQALTVTATSDNTNLIPNPNVSYASPNTNGSITLRPANNMTGTARITVTVSDGAASNSQSFVANIKALTNILPTISVITNRTTPEDTPVAIPCTVRDAETPVTNLVLTAVTSNPLLLPLPNIGFTGTGSNRTVTLTPAADRTGVAAVTLTVTDDAFGSSNMTFTLTVTGVNDAPVISAITNRTTAEDTLIQVPFTIGDLETPAGNLGVSVTSSNLALVPNANLVVGGSGSNRVLIITPATNQTGTATIVVRVNDGLDTNSASFVLTVTGVNDAPALSAIADQSTAEDTPLGPIAFLVQDLETAPGALTLSAASSNPSLVATSSITFGGSSSNRTLTLTPQTNSSGSAVITITVSDGVATASSSFTLTVTPGNDPPTLAALPDVRVNQNSGPRALALTGISPGAGEANEAVSVTASTTGTNLVRILGVEYSGGSTGMLTIQPFAGATGTASVTVVVFDGAATNNAASQSFTVSVNAAPTLGYIPDQTTLESTPTAPIAITIGDADTPPGQLSLDFSASGPLFPPGSAAFSGTNAQRTLVLTPASGLTGLTLATVTVTDAEGAGAHVSFFVTVTHSNRPPTIGSISNQTTLEDTPITVPFTIGDLEAPAGSLMVTGFSSSAIIPAANFQFSGSGSNRFLTLLGLTNASGATTITIAVADDQGARSSNTFNLLVQPVPDPITILTQPQGLTVLPGAQVTFTCIAESGVTPGYQWRRNGSALPGASGTSLILSNVQPADSATYTCLVTNDDTFSVLSAPADLTVFNGARILSIARTGSVAAVTYTTFPGTTNTLEFKVLVIGPGWNPLGSLVATGSVMTAPDPGATNSTRFYRVRTGF